MRLLLVESDPALARSLRRDLEPEGFVMDLAAGPGEGDTRVRARGYDVIVLDLMRAGDDGLALLRRWRGGGLDTHVLVLGRQGRAADTVAALNRGADGALARPFALAELRARLRALVRRAYRVKDPVLRTHDLEINTASRTVRRAGRAVPLTPRLYALLQLLAFHRGRVVSRATILDRLCGRAAAGDGSNLVDVFIRLLRRRVDRGYDPPLIRTVWGRGYLLRPDDG